MNKQSIKQFIEAVDLIAADSEKEAKKVRKAYKKRTGKEPKGEPRQELYHRAQAEVMQLLSESLTGKLKDYK